MKCLVVTTHPLNASLCKQLTEYAASQLTKMGHEVTIEDLYAENFNPALTSKERESYYNDRYDSSDISGHVTKLVNAEALVLLFPTWWFGYPAMLKGWFDRVWGPGIAYQNSNNCGSIKPHLTHLKRVLVITTLGSPWWIDRLVMRQPVKRLTKLALLNACTKKSKLQFLSLYNSEALTEHKIKQFKTKINKAIERWEQ